MKKKLVSRIVSWLMLICFIFTLSGCDILYSMIPEICPHAWEEIFRENATCQSVGSVESVCEICGKEKIEELPLTSHSFATQWYYNESNHWHKCDNCATTEQSSLHTFVTENDKEICSVCGYEKIQAKGAISFHFMMQGNAYSGDSIYIKAGDNDILIDAGSRKESIDYIDNYLKQYVTDGKLEYVIVTHADRDHIAGFSKRDGSLFDLYDCGTIIDFPRTDKNTETYNDYVLERTDEVNAGAKHYTALECYNNQNGAKRVYDLTADGNVKMEILYNYFYEHKSSDENNYSVCLMFYHGSRQFLFTGDLEEEGEEYLAEKYDFTQVELYKAGHHGSKTSSNECLLSEIKPKMCVACCCAGSTEFAKEYHENTFPTQAMIDRIAPYTDKFFVPIYIEVEQIEGMDTPNDRSDDKFKDVGEYKLLNGNIQIISDAKQGVYAECSNNNTLLKDTDWFKKYRTMPEAWKIAS